MNFADQEEIAERQNKRNRKRRNNVIWNLLTALFVIASLAAIGYFVVLFSNPAVSINPFPPPTMPVLIEIPTSTPTLVKTWTPTLTGTPVPVAGVTYTLPEGTTPTPLVTDSNAKYAFALKSDPNAIANTVFHPDGNCNWQGVAGQVVDLQGRAVVGLMVHLRGVYNGKAIDQTTLTGGAQAWYGESGYEFVLGNTPIDSTALLSIQLSDQSSVVAISDKVVFNTYSACEKNLILINFQQVK